MNTAFEIAKRISFQKSKTNTSFIVKLSIAATSISIAAIILTFSIVNGFQAQIAQKVYNFWGGERITAINGNLLKEDTLLVHNIKKIPQVLSVEAYATQTAVIAFQSEMEAVIVKGIDKTQPIPFSINSDKRTIQNIKKPNQIVLSDNIANKLNARIGGVIRINFLINGKTIVRNCLLTGIYHSGIEEYDAQFVYIDLQILQHLNFDPTSISGYSIHFKENSSTTNLHKEIQSLCPPNIVATRIEDDYPQIFDWIGVQTINRNVAITIMLIIAIVNLITCLFILMLERVHMIGTLTAMGANYQLIQKVFLYQISFISWTGIVIGSIIGLGLSLLQQFTSVIQLDESAYFIKTLPIKIIPLQIVLILLGTAAVSYIAFLIPTIWIRKISPAKTIRFD